MREGAARGSTYDRHFGESQYARRSDHGDRLARPRAHDLRAQTVDERVGCHRRIGASRGGLPVEAVSLGARYFLEVHIATEVLEGFVAEAPESPSALERCARVIRYAIDDA